jgi:D-3-phosphoglycerate dehydrogenase
MKCLIGDSFEADGLDRLRQLGLTITQDAALMDDALKQAIVDVDPDILIVRGTKVTGPMIQAGKSLGLIVRAGAGYNTIDVATASGRGVYVANCPGKNAAAVAELAFGLILSLDRRIPDAVADLRAGKWNKKEYSKAQGVKGRVLGIIGVGGIGREMIQRARGFDMPVVAWSRSLTDDEADALDVRRAASAADVAAACDVLSIHVALTPETRGMINDVVLDRLKPGAMFINTSRGEVVDHAALRKAIETRKLRVGLDVFEKEPSGGGGEFADDIVQLSGVYGTHHVGASTEQAQVAIAREAVRVVAGYVETGAVANCVNMCARSPARRMLVVRHANKPGVLSHVLGLISHAGINVEEMENVIFSDAKAACARIRLDDAPAADVLGKIESGQHVLAVSLLDLPA